MSSDDSGVNRPRRTFIKSAGIAGAVGLAGCSGGGDGGDGGGGDGDGAGGSDGGTGGTATPTPTNTPPEASTVLNFWTLFGGGDGVVMSSMIDKFNDERPLGDDIAIHRQRLPWDEYYDTFYTSMVGGEAPDIGIMHGSLLRSYGDVLTDFSPYLDASLSEDYLDTFVDFVTIDGSINALPLDYHPCGVYYNKEIFEEAGLDPESPPSNWEEFKNAGDTVVAETDNDAWCPTPYQDGVGSYRAWSSWVRQAGGELWSEGYEEPVFDNDVALEMTQLLYDMTGEWGWAPQSAEENWGNQQFQNGDLAMVTNGTWYVNVMREMDFEWGFFKPNVAPNHQQNAAWADGHTLVMPRNPDRSEERSQAIADAVKWITTQNPEWGAEAGHFPAARNIHESGALEEAEFYDDTLSKYFEMAENDEYFFHPQTPTGDSNNEAWYDWLVDVWAHNAEPQAAIDDGISTINNALN